MSLVEQQDKFLKDYLVRVYRDNPDMRRKLVQTAEEWFGSRNSRMCLFSESNGFLFWTDFGGVADEAALARKELSSDNSKAWEALCSLEIFARDIYALSGEAWKVLISVSLLKKMGVRKYEIKTLFEGIDDEN